MARISPRQTIVPHTRTEAVSERLLLKLKAVNEHEEHESKQRQMIAEAQQTPLPREEVEKSYDYRNRPKAARTTPILEKDWEDGAKDHLRIQMQVEEMLAISKVDYSKLAPPINPKYKERKDSRSPDKELE